MKFKIGRHSFILIDSFKKQNNRIAKEHTDILLRFFNNAVTTKEEKVKETKRIQNLTISSNNFKKLFFVNPN